MMGGFPSQRASIAQSQYMYHDDTIALPNKPWKVLYLIVFTSFNMLVVSTNVTKLGFGQDK